MRTPHEKRLRHHVLLTIGWILLLPIVVIAQVNHNGATVSTDRACQMIARKLASVSLANCRHRNLQASGAYSVRGTPLLIKEYPPLPPRLPKARVLVIGGVHGDEYSSVSIMFKWLKILDKHHSGLFHWQMVPLLNPDGLLRKRSQRMNANGVDLNRNFATPNWQEESRHYWIQRTRRNPRRYPGSASLSEPETRWLTDVIEHFEPHAIVAVHAPHGIIDFDGPPPRPRKFGHLRLRLLGTYPGSLGNYAGVQKKIPVITIELPHAGIMPTRRQISYIWVDLVRWLRRHIPAPMQ
ncbi:MAG: M14 family murein peptide amidase A [Candidatus Tectomicrobia bacterium]